MSGSLAYQVPAGIDPEIVTPPAHDQLATITALQDPSLIEFHAKAVADQMLKGAKQNGWQGDVVDLSAAIADIVIESTIQGASILEVHIIDTHWQLLTSGFIDVDESGWLLPIDVNFPLNTDCWWRLCAANPTTDTGGPNLTLTFEDRIVSKMREKLGPAQSFPSEFLSTFIAGLVKDVDGVRGDGIPSIRFVSKVSQPTNALTAQKPSPAPTLSSQQKNASPSRKADKSAAFAPGPGIYDTSQAVNNAVSRVVGGTILALLGGPPEATAA